MSAPLIWIGLPIVVAVFLWVIRKYTNWVAAVGVGLCILLAGMASFIRLDYPMDVGPITLRISSVMSVFGRQFILEQGSMPALSFIYGFSAFWFLGGWIYKSHRFFIPFGLAVVALLIAALAVEPFLYAALLVETAVLLTIPMMAPPEIRAGKGVTRYLIFQTLAVPFILLAGWLLGVGGLNPSDKQLLIQALLVLGLGFAFWLAIFPFYTWVPLIAGETQPLIAGFILTIFPTVVLLLLLDFLNAFGFLRNSDLFYPALQTIGIIMVATGGVWATFQKEVTRIFGYAVIMETGFSLLALSLNNQAGLEIYVMQFLPRGVALFIFAAALHTIRIQGMGTTLDDLRGLYRKMPIVGVALTFAVLSLSGLPLFASYPVRQPLVSLLAQQNFTGTLWVFLGVFGFLTTAMRLIAFFAAPDRTGTRIRQRRLTIALFMAGMAALIVIGLLPGPILSTLLGILNSFPNLSAL